MDIEVLELMERLRAIQHDLQALRWRRMLSSPEERRAQIKRANQAPDDLDRTDQRSWQAAHGSDG